MVVKPFGLPLSNSVPLAWLSLHAPLDPSEPRVQNVLLWRWLFRIRGGLRLEMEMGDSYLVSASVIGTAASDHSSMAKIKMLSRHLEILRNCFSFTNFVQIAFESYGPGVGRFVFLCCISRSLFLLFFFCFPISLCWLRVWGNKLHGHFV